MNDYGLTEKLLSVTFKEVQTGKRTLSWSLKGTPNVGFYCILHPYLKRWLLSKSTTKVAIEKYYIAIDKNLQAKGSNPYNTYRFIETLVKSGQSPSTLMTYGFECAELKRLQQQMKECYEQVQRLTTDVNDVKEELMMAKSEICSTRLALKDLNNELHDTKKAAKYSSKGKQSSPL